ncbi:MAG: C10 family peptidase [Omnitrophica WOR_2 bacterium]
MIKKVLFTLLIVISLSNIHATPVDKATATRVAVNFLNIRSQIYHSGTTVNEIREVTPIIQSETMAYIVNFVNGGFVIIAADDASRPVLGYSYEGEFSITNIPPEIDEWMQFYYNQIKDLRKNNTEATPEINQEWSNLLNGTSYGERDLREVAPLESTTWDQGARYNELCPADAGGPGGHVYSGCVATAMSQILNYWRYPLQGTGTHGYTSDYGYLEVNYGASRYNYNEMNAGINSESNHEMAEIQYHCGVAVNMMYSPTGSGAYSQDAVAALQNYFGYSQDLALEQKEDYSDEAWQNLIMSNLDNGWPLYYHGFGSGGHAFNLDGYQGTDYFHFNWGWSGSFNGYFYLTNLNPGGSDFSWGQGAIVNFHPAEGSYPYYCNGVDTLSRHNGTIEDGSGPVDNYIDGLNCGWLIAPEDSVTDLTLYFDKFDLAAGDVVNVFDGTNSAAPLVGSYTGNSIPAAIPSQSGSLYLEFLTAGAQGKGFKAHYNSYLINYCPGITHYTDASGSFTDGSGPRDYRNKSICKYIIEPDNAATITLSFNKFNTESNNDELKVYDMITQQLLGAFSGNELPNNVVVPSRKAYVLFVSNDSVTNDGWELSYTSTITGTSNEFVSGNEINIYCTPNPASDWLRVELSTKNHQNVQLTMVSPDGRSTDVFNGQVSSEPVVVMKDVSHLSAGLYFIICRTDTDYAIKKVVIN